MRFVGFEATTGVESSEFGEFDGGAGHLDVGVLRPFGVRGIEPGASRRCTVDRIDEPMQFLRQRLRDIERKGVRRRRDKADDDAVNLRDADEDMRRVQQTANVRERRLLVEGDVGVQTVRFIEKPTQCD